MILQRLVELAHRENLVADPAFEKGSVTFLLELDAKGTFLGLQSLLSPKPKGKGLESRTMSIPFLGKRPGNIKPRFLCDESHYVLGHDLLNMRAAKGLQGKMPMEHQAWCDLVSEAEQSTHDAALTAILLFLDNPQEKTKAIEDLEARCKELQAEKNLPPTINLSFSLQGDGGTPVFHRPQVADWWRARSGGQVKQRAGVRCLIDPTKVAAEISQHPAIKKVPAGAASGCSLVSFNQSAFESFGFRKYENAPMSQETVDAYTRALNRLLDDRYPDPQNPSVYLPRRRINLSQDTAIVYWASQEEELLDLFAQVAEPDPSRVEALLSGPQVGKEISISEAEAARFYALVLSGAKARIIVRDWFETSVAAFARNIRDYFDDIAIVGVPRATLPLWRLLDATIPVLDGKPARDRLHPALSARLWQDILRGRPFAPVLLQTVVLRIRTEGAVRREQAALLRAYFNRLARRATTRGSPHHLPEVSYEMDENNKEPAYLLGRAFAVLEKLQKDAIPGINQTIADRFYGAASATPAVVLPTLIRKSKAHIAKASSGRYLDGILVRILASLDRFPPVLGLEEQGLFAIGYYHQRQALYTRKSDSGSASSQENPS
ncbi:MAG: type I-C CRISPR-associated protein Cas8c/Csd1 [Myxococcales bacterium]|nr:type I-C CRISPR-associated protein Cas8c/Csd1 [Polyangiaceae bacterium]MDW8251775.1 type I-C CRISPR-associated protein Cas8c/Csd1 [Myxococcales bacterium]